MAYLKTSWGGTLGCFFVLYTCVATIYCCMALPTICLCLVEDITFADVV